MKKKGKKREKGKIKLETWQHEVLLEAISCTHRRRVTGEDREAGNERWCFGSSFRAPLPLVPGLGLDCGFSQMLLVMMMKWGLGATAEARRRGRRKEEISNSSPALHLED